MKRILFILCCAAAMARLAPAPRALCAEDPGYYIFFSSERDAVPNHDSNRTDFHPEIYRMDPDGSNQIRITDNEYPEIFFAAAPGADRIFYSVDEDDDYEIYSIGLDGDDEERLSDDMDMHDLAASVNADQTLLAYAARPSGQEPSGRDDAEILLMDLDTLDKTQLTDNGKWDFYPALSPDGKSVVFKRFEQWTGDYENISRLYVVDLETGEERKFQAKGVEYYTSAEFSPDGRFLATAVASKYSSKFTLFSWPDEDLVFSYDDGQMYCNRHAFSADGSTLAVNCFTGIFEKHKIVIVDLTGDEPQVAQVLKPGRTVWDFDISPQGDYIFFSGVPSTEDHWEFWEIYRMDTQTGDVEQLTDNGYSENEILVVSTVSYFDEEADEDEDEDLEDEDEEDEDG